MTSPDLEALKTLVAQSKELDRCEEEHGSRDTWATEQARDQAKKYFFEDARNAMPSIERLLAGQQEPVAWAYAPNVLFGEQDFEEDDFSRDRPVGEDWVPLFAAPPVQEAGREPDAYMFTIRRVSPAGQPSMNTFAAIDYHLQDGEELREKEPLYLKAVPAEPASLGAEAAAREIDGWLGSEAAILGPWGLENREHRVAHLEAIIRKHQPIKAG